MASIYRNTTLKVIDLINSILINLISIFWIGVFVESKLKALLLVGVTVFYIVTSIALKNKAVLKKYIQLQFLSGLVSFGFALITQYSNFPALLSLLLFAEVSIGIFITLTVIKKPFLSRVIALLNIIPILITITEYPSLLSNIYSNNFSSTDSGLATILYTMCAVFLGVDYVLLKKFDTEKSVSLGLKVLTTIWITSIIFVVTGLLVPFISGSIGLLLSLLIVFYWFSDHKISTQSVFNNSLLVLALLAGFRAIWSGFYTIIGSDFYVGASLVVYSIIALLLTRYSHKLGTFWKHANLVIFGFIVFRLFVFEFWEMEMFARFVTFFAVGVLFISTPYIAKKQNVK